MQKRVTPITSFDDIPYPYDVKYVKIEDNQTIAYFDEGQGPAVLMIHGLGSYAPAWKKTISNLKTDFRCIAIDLPSYGRSTKGNFEGSMSSYVEVIKKVLTELNIDKATLMGHSMGGQIAMLFYLAYPDKVDKLVLISPAGFETFSPGQKEWFMDVVTPRAIQLTPVETIVSNVGYNFYDFPADAQFMIDDRIAMRTANGFDAYCHQIAKSVAGMLEEPVFEYLPRIRANTLVIYGRQDNLIPNRFLNPGSTEEIAKKGVEKLNHVQLEMIDKAGHFVHFERPQIVNPMITEFLKK